MKQFIYIFFCSAILFSWSCNDPLEGVPSGSTVPVDDLLDSPLELNMNPNGKTPLSGRLKVQTKHACDIEIILKEDPSVRFSSKNKKEHSFNIIGLFASSENTLNFSFRTVDSMYNAVTTYKIETPSLPDFFPDLEILKSEAAQMEPGWNLVELNIGSKNGFQFYPIVFDELGRIRYYLDLSHRVGWIGPLKFTENKTWLFGQFDFMDEYDLLFNKIEDWKFNDHNIHHDFYIKDNGNILLCTSKKNTPTNQDHLIEYNPNSQNIVNTWDFRELLDVDRNEMNWNSSDWVHTNSVSYIESQNINVLSGRYQGVFGIDNNRELKWIMSPHKGWGKSGMNGDGHETSDFLLTAVNANDEPYNEDVQLGLEHASDFSWTWGQHACHAMENGNIICFDNGWKTNFSGDAGYSRMVEYEIDADAMTVKQVWEYGKERGADLFSSNISDVDILPLTSNRLMIPGNVTGADGRQSRMVEIKYPSKEVVFEVVIRFKNQLSTGNGWTQADLIYQGERIDLFK